MATDQKKQLNFRILQENEQNYVHTIKQLTSLMYHIGFAMIIGNVYCDDYLTRDFLVDGRCISTFFF